MWPSGKWNHMPLEASAYQNMNHEHVDWASLAQQWIRMKETVVVDVPHTASGPQPITTEKVRPVPAQPASGFFNTDSSNGMGEAPMDVEKDEDNGDVHLGSSSWNWSQQMPQLGWPQNTISFPIRPDFPQQVMMTNGIHQPPPPGQSPYHFGPSGNLPIGLGLPRLPLLPIPQSKMGSSDEDSCGATSSPFIGMPTLDAAKRKNLPAWIREGLEKMEREKLKKEEREKLLQERELKRQSDLQSKLSMSDTASVTRSKFDDTEDEDESDGDNETPTVPSATVRPPPKESTEQILVTIRQLMTEVLLEVTTEEILATATEVCQQTKVKSRQAQPSLSSKSLTQKLGLDQYGSDSDSHGDSEEEGPTETRSSSSSSESEASYNLNGKIGGKDRSSLEGKVKNDSAEERSARHSPDVEERLQHSRVDKISKSPKDGSKVDTDISGNLPHGAEEPSTLKEVTQKPKENVRSGSASRDAESSRKRKSFEKNSHSTSGERSKRSTLDHSRNSNRLRSRSRDRSRNSRRYSSEEDRNRKSSSRHYSRDERSSRGYNSRDRKSNRSKRSSSRERRDSRSRRRRSTSRESKNSRSSRK